MLASTPKVTWLGSDRLLARWPHTVATFLEITGVYVNVIELSAELYRQYPQKYAKYALTIFNCGG
jgi:hypothetical protein